MKSKERCYIYTGVSTSMQVGSRGYQARLAVLFIRSRCGETEAPALLVQMVEPHLCI